MRIVVALALFAAMAVAGVPVWRKLDQLAGEGEGASKPAKGGGRGKRPSGKPKEGAGSRAADEVVPLATIGEQHMERTDGAIVTAVKVESLNTSLFTKAEEIKEAARNAAAIATIEQPFAIYQVHRSPDNARQREAREARLAEIDSKLSHIAWGSSGDPDERAKERQYLLFRRALLRRYMEDDERAGVNPQSCETDTFIVLRTDPRPRKDTLEAAEAATRSLLTHLTDYGFTATRLDGAGLRWLLKAHFDEPCAPGADLTPTSLVAMPEYAAEIAEAAAGLAGARAAGATGQEGAAGAVRGDRHAA